VIFEPTQIPGVLRVLAEPMCDARGSFARLFDAEAFAAQGLCVGYPQHSVATNAAAGIVRGLHFQIAPHEETKIIRCTAGAVFDVLLDVRKESPAYGRWLGFDLHAGDGVQLYVPGGIAHGYQSISPTSEMHYLISAPYQPESARGFRYDSPSLGIPWPLAAPILSERDLSWPPFEAGLRLVEEAQDRNA